MATLSEAEIDLGSSIGVIRWGKKVYPFAGRHLGTGNRCGHDPKKPEFHWFIEPSWAPNVPQIMRKLLEAVKGYYFTPLDLLPSLANLNGRKNKCGTPRKNRTEARAVEVLVLRAILYFVDYASLRVGTPKDDGGFIPRSCTEIARMAGLLRAKKDPNEPDEPSARFWRAFSRLRKSGAFDVHLQYVEKPDGTKRARPAIKRVNENFLIALGAVSAESLKRFRDHCSNQLKAARRAYREQFPIKSDAEKARKDLRRKQGDSGVVTHAVGAYRNNQKAKDSPESREQHNRESMAYFAELVKKHPDKSRMDIVRLQRSEFPDYDEWLRQRQGVG